MSHKIVINKGDKYGYQELTGKEKFKGRYRRRYVECKCICGKVRYVSIMALVRGESKSCGCKMKELVSIGRAKHGLTKTSDGKPNPLYQAWSNMRSRCNSKSSTRYKNYGGRGISICKEWDDFEVFYNWAMSLGWSNGLTIERNDVNGNYSPNNCSLIPLCDQGRNRTTTRLLEAFGESKSISEWAKDARCVVSYGALKSRVWGLKWNLEEALTIKRISPGYTKNKQCAD